MPPLRRHQLAYLGADGWRDVLAAPWDDEAHDCLRHWAGARLPLVVTRQRAIGPASAASVALGLPAPQRWGRRRLSLQVRHAAIDRLDEFPLLPQVLSELPCEARSPLLALTARLQSLGVSARAYGSAGWQHLTGLPYLHPHSDLDIWLAVDGVGPADRAAHALSACDVPGMRLDGELVWHDGAAVAWREWLSWRAGDCQAVLVKRLQGVALERREPATRACA